MSQKFDKYFSENISNVLIRENGTIDVFAVSDQTGPPKKPKGVFALLPNINTRSKIEYFMVTFWLISIIGLNLILNFYISYLSVGFIFLVSVSFISLFFKRGPVLYFASLSAIFWNFMFIKPRFTFFIEHLEDLLMFLMYFITAIIIGNLSTQLRVKEIFLRKREKNLEELYLMGKILNESNTKEEITEKSIALIKKIFSIQISIFLRDENNCLSIQPWPGNDLILSDTDWQAALWSFKNCKPCGRNTEFMELSRYYHIPMQTHMEPVGVMVIDHNKRDSLSSEEENLLLALIAQITSAINRNDFAIAQQKIKLADESEKIYQILLNSVSHELRTPITTISTAANGLIDENLEKNSEIRKIFANDIIDASDRLNRIVDNLLGSLRIESDKIILNLEWYDLSELISHILKKLTKILKHHKFAVTIDETIPMVKFDFILMEQLLTNLIYNAVLYTPAGSDIQLHIKREDTMIKTIISDNGFGIAAIEKDKIFNKFYRAKGTKSGGLGLGLSICKEIAEIHQGTIDYETNPQGGASFIVKLPLLQSNVQGELS